MWPFNHRKKRADEAVGVFHPTADIVAEKWRAFCQSTKFKDDVTLGQKIAVFSAPVFEGMRENIPELRTAPDSFLLMILASAIDRSGTNSREEIVDALCPPGQDPEVIRRSLDVFWEDA
jgi:hypothetical protein